MPESRRNSCCVIYLHVYTGTIKRMNPLNVKIWSPIICKGIKTFLHIIASSFLSNIKKKPIQAIKTNHDVSYLFTLVLKLSTAL